MTEAVAILGPSSQSFCLRDATFENKLAVWNIGYFFRQTYLKHLIPQNPFDMKRFLSRFSMLPVLYLELIHGQYPYKRDAFEMARSHVPKNLFHIFDIVSDIRQQWHPEAPIQLAPSFYNHVFELSEWVLKQLAEQKNDKH